jgi:hypothetical protein
MLASAMGYPHDGPIFQLRLGYQRIWTKLGPIRHIQTLMIAKIKF